MERKYNRLKALLLYFALPSFIYIFFIFGGFINVFIESLGYIKSLGMTELTLQYYQEIFTDGNFMSASIYSIYLAVASSVLSTVIGVYLAQYLTFNKGRFTGTAVFGLSGVIVILPYLFSILLVIWMFSGSGLLARILFNLGFNVEVDLLYGKFGLGMILTFVLKGSAFMAIYVYNVMSEIRKDYFILAKSMGVGRTKAVVSIYIPLCKNAIVWASAVLFAYYMGSYEVPMLLSGIEHSTLAAELYGLYTSSDYTDFPRAMATNIVMLLLNLVFGGMYAFVIKKLIERGVRG